MGQEWSAENHPWIDFAIDLRDAPPALWMMLGEAQSKTQHIEGVPLKPEEARQLYLLFLAKGALATTAIEGNTLSEEQVWDHLNGRLKLPPSQEYLAKEIDNIIDACNELWRELETGESPSLTLDRIRHYNQQVLNDLELDPEVVPGDFRTHSVVVGRYKCPPAHHCEDLLRRLLDWLESDAFKPQQPDQGFIYAYLKAILAHLYLVWIHPFGDGNGRTARLIEVHILSASGVPKPVVHLLSNHYNFTRAEYYRRLDRSSREPNGEVTFVQYAAQGLVEQLRAQLRIIREQQWSVTWQNFVHEAFAGKKGPTAQRRRQLVLDLSKMEEPVPKGQLVVMTPALARMYAGTTEKTLTRDLNVLMRMDLITRERGRLRARTERIQAFLPAKACIDEHAVADLPVGPPVGKDIIKTA
ncbi:MAG: Fic family protein [Actinomycetota bacterium]|nr:Fic family protein [Actinomycetota bacterium]